MFKPPKDNKDVEAMMAPATKAFRYWVSFWPVAPFFGVEWRFAEAARRAGLPVPEADPSPRPKRMADPLKAMRQMKPLAPPLAKGAPQPSADDVEEAIEKIMEPAKPAAKSRKSAAKALKPVDEIEAPDRPEDVDTSLDVEPLDLDVPGGQSEDAEKVAEAAGKTGGTSAEEAPSAKAGDGSAEQAGGDSSTSSDAAASGDARDAAAEDGTAGSDEGEPQLDFGDDGPAKPDGLYDERPEDADDLKVLKGIGPGLEKQLNGIGIYKLDQVAGFSREDLAWIDENLTSFKGRSIRDDWVGQAKDRLSS